MKRQRHRARTAALRILYFWEVSGAEPEEAVDAYFETHEPDAPDNVRAFARELVLGTAAEHERLDTLIAAHTEHWRVERLAVIDRLILRMAAWELGHEPETPPPVVLNEAVELARAFGADESGRFVNGVLDSIRKGS
jgi:N utilization substance protein B